MVKLSINPSLEYLYSLWDTQTRVLEFTRLHLTKKSLFISTALDLEPPAHAPDMSQTCSLPAGHGGCGDGEGRRRREVHICIFSNPCIPDLSDLVAWSGRRLHSFVPGTFRSAPSLQSWENTLFSCKHQHIINTKPVFIPSSLQLHNSCNNRLPHPFVRIILANCSIHPTTSLPQTLCKLWRVSSVPACWAFFLL